MKLDTQILIGVKMSLFLELIWGLDNTTLTAEAEDSINFSRSQKTFCLRIN